MVNDLSQTTYKCVWPRWCLSYLPPHLSRFQIRLAAIHVHRNAVSSYLTEYEIAGHAGRLGWFLQLPMATILRQCSNRPD